MQFDLKDLLQAIGPTASLVFAAWIFLSFLESRYVAAFERYRALTNDFRQAEPGRRHEAVRRQIVLYKRRCTWMRRATNIGVVSAIFLICTLLVGAANVVFPGHGVLPPLAALLATVGLLMVIAAASLVLVENGIVKEAIEEEVSDLPELRAHDGARPDHRPADGTHAASRAR